MNRGCSGSRFGLGAGATGAVIASRWTRKQAKRVAPADARARGQGRPAGPLEARLRVDRRRASARWTSASAELRRRAASTSPNLGPKAGRTASPDGLTGRLAGVDGARIRETFLAFFEERGHTRVRSASLIAAPESGLLLTGRRHGAVHPVLPRTGRAAVPPRGVSVAEVLPRQRHRERRPHRSPPHDVRDARELLLRRLLQGRVLRVGARARHRGVRDRSRAPVDHRVRGRRRGDRHLAGPRHPGGADRAPRQSRQLLVDPRRRTGRALLGDLRRPRPAATGPTADRRSTKSGSWRSGTTSSCRTRSTAHATSSASSRTRTSTPARRSSVSRWCCRAKASFFETDLFAPLLEEVAVALGQALRRRRAHDVSIRIIGEHASSHGVPGRRRGAAVERGARVHPAAHAAPRGLARAPAGGRARGAPAARRSWSSTGSATRTRSSGRTGRSSSRSLGSEEERFSRHPATGHGAVRGGARPCRRRARVAGADAFKLSDTFGFPIELTIELAADAGLHGRRGPGSASCSRSRRTARARPRRRWRSAWTPARCPPTEFVGYDQPEAEAPITLLLGDDRAQSSRSPRRARRCGCSSTARRSTPRAGVRSGTEGVIRTHTGTIRVHRHPVGRRPRRSCTTAWSSPARSVPGRTRSREIDRQRREATARAHTSTHVVHWTLEAHPRRARPSGRLARRARPAAVRLPPSERRSRSRCWRRPSSRRTGVWRTDDASRIFETSMDEAQGARRDGAVRREVRRRRARRRDRRLLARAVRRHPRRSHRHDRRDPASCTKARSGPGCAASRRWSGPTPCARSTPSAALLRGLVEALGSEGPTRRPRARSPDRRGEQAPEERARDASRAADRDAVDRRARRAAPRESTASRWSPRRSRTTDAERAPRAGAEGPRPARRIEPAAVVVGQRRRAARRCSWRRVTRGAIERGVTAPGSARRRGDA